jgi:hypothetical protein
MTDDIRAEADLVILRPTGAWTVEQARDHQREAARIMRNSRLRALLVDLRQARAAFSTSDILELTASHLERFPLGTRHAVVYAADTAPAEDARFVETVAFNRGLQLRMYTDIAAARRWLLQRPGEPDPPPDRPQRDQQFD